MVVSLAQELLMYAVYFAPRGKERLLALGHQLAQKHLSPSDKLIGLVGEAGAGKSQLIRGLFPGLELTNDDEGVAVRPLPLLGEQGTGFFNIRTYHVDIRFESAFTQLHVLAEAVTNAVTRGKRVVIEHFDLLYPMLKTNADILIGIGEEVIVTRPNLFGPLPGDLANIVFKSIHYRRMAHSAEDITCKILEEEFGFAHGRNHSDVKHGFVLQYDHDIEVDIADLERRVQGYIDRQLDIGYIDERHITLGKGDVYHCTGPRIHVHNTGDIENFQLIKELKYDPVNRVYALVGLVGSERAKDLDDLNKLTL